jgi:hypothetical protein
MKYFEAMLRNETTHFLKKTSYLEYKSYQHSYRAGSFVDTNEEIADLPMSWFSYGVFCCGC